jgi:chemotaxis protein methyltransferase CheR
VPVLDTLVSPMGPREFNMFRELVHQRTGIWLRDGKQVMLASRLSRRLRHHGLTSFADYYAFVQNDQNDSEEIHELINCVTTNKTSFFRERHHFEFLANTVMPQIQSATRFDAPKSIRVWSAASSTGEEPYSIAITLLESAQALHNSKHGDGPQPAPTRAGLPGLNLALGGWRIEITASDIDTAVLETAKRAVYKHDLLETVDPQLHGKYFLLGKDDMQGYVKVKQDAARLVQFKRINLVDKQWPLDGLYDVIFFRNALIYFNQETQDVFLRKMARYLKPGGYLFLGHSEHIPWLGDILTPLKQTMYQLRGKS